MKIYYLMHGFKCFRCLQRQSLKLLLFYLNVFCSDDGWVGKYPLHVLL